MTKLGQQLISLSCHRGTSSWANVSYEYRVILYYLHEFLFNQHRWICRIPVPRVTVENCRDFDRVMEGRGLRTIDNWYYPWIELFPGPLIPVPFVTRMPTNADKLWHLASTCLLFAPIRASGKILGLKLRAHFFLGSRVHPTKTALKRYLVLPLKKARNTSKF